MMDGISFRGWDSLDSVQHIHSVLDLVALLFFAFLVLADIFEHLATERKAKRYKVAGLVFFGLAILTELIAYPYSRRNDRLSQDRIHTQELAIAKFNKEAGEARNTAGKFEEHAKELEKQIEELKGRNLELQQQADKERNSRLEWEAPRRITDKQASVLATRVQPLKGKKLEIDTFP